MSYGWTAARVHTADYLEPIICKFVRRYQPRTILDAGCGNGSLAAKLTQDGYTVTGIDADAGGIEIAQSLYPGIDFRVGSFTDQPPVVDLVISTEVIEHLYAPEGLVRYAAKALAPGGRFIISTPYHGYWKNIALSFANKWDHHHGVDWTGGHVKFFSARTLTALLQAHGFTVTDFVGVGRIPYLWKSMILVAHLS